MGEILTIGLTHYPPLAWHDDKMAIIMDRMLENPRLPRELRTPEGWPPPMRDEWGSDHATTAAARHRADLLRWFRRQRAAIDEFKPDFVLIWGDDQYENFKEDVIPPYCICAYESIDFSPPPDNVWNESPGQKYHVEGHPTGAKYLTARLLEAGFDAAYAYRPLHHPLGHAFGNAILYLDYDRRGFPYPIIPFAINCYGRRVVAQKGGLPVFENPPAESQLDPPSPTPQRLFDLGAAVAATLSDSHWRVVLMASSSWSHAFLTAKNNFLYPDIDADRRLYEALRVGDYSFWRSYPLAAIEDCGQQEVLNWMCLVGALACLNRRPAETGFITTWVLNSNKCFLIA